MIKFFSRMTIATRLVVSFSVIIILFIIVTLYSQFAMNEADRLYQHHLNYVVVRREYVLSLDQQFTHLRLLARRSLRSETWRVTAGDEDWQVYEAEIIRTYDNIFRLAEDYNESVMRDMRIDEDGRQERVGVMDSITDLIERIYDVHRRNFFSDGEQSFDAENVDYYRDIIIEYLETLLLATEELTNELMAEIEETLAVNQTLTIVASVAILFLAVALAWLVIKSFTGRIKLITAAALKTKQGDFSDNKYNGDEISNIISGIVNIFIGLVREIEAVTEENEKGNPHARIHAGQFEGGYRDTALKINNLLDRINEQNEQNEFILNTMPFIIMFWDKNKQIIDCNREGMQTFGMTSKIDLASQFWRYCPEYQPCGKKSVDLLDAAFRQAWEQGFVIFDWIHLVKGKPIFYRASLQRVEFKGENVLLSVGRDISAEKEIEAERLRVAIAEENSRAKSRFLARMSHEIRTPLTSILGIADIQLQVPGHTLSVEEAFAKIHSSSNILLDIVNDILDLSKIEAGKMRIFEERYELASLIVDVVQLHLVLLGSKTIEFKVDVDETLPAYLIGDELRLKQILNNLLSNAFKYTEDGTVTLTIRREPHSSPDSIVLMLAIQDTGFGMDEEQLGILKSGEYVRFNEKENRAVTGSGLGIPIVINLIQLMDAEIDFTSNPGEGTRVEVRIPQQISGSELLGHEIVNSFRHSEIMQRTITQKIKFIPEPMPYGRVLVVDDVDTNLYVIKGLLTFYELEIDTCISGREAIEKIKSGNIYDIVFMDHMMPDLNGIQTTQILREMGYNHPVVALTANALVGQAEEFLNNGFDGFISKPIQTAHINGILNKFVRDKQSDDVISKARQSRRTRAEIEGKGIDSFMENELERLRIDFAKKEKNAVAEIKAALEEGDFESAQRKAHTVKGLAGFIQEDELARVAAVLEEKYGEKELADLSEFDEALTTVLAQIVIPNDDGASKVSTGKLQGILNQLEPLLENGDTQCDEFVPALEKIPETLVLAHQVSDYSFDDALVTLNVLRIVLNERGAFK